ncbi:retropepsin-like aspartic protease [Chitinophaga nivalis]|uniref:Retroviral-like aspartic protease family protein n=1 Tax=Chitinophaga nivalis TaxID=2991709 RepID=A0ABT3IV34_9BACT|nr:retropepsin-like aspartic protease [Chitinophaga nivalis]MCW3462447.1 retroviral-like aspartic protease family protein [Chitinophaga nivalis]MCW3487862.1 retroviral-like aspartic protease family protein [Chitinophaga nivalis]
MWRYSWIVIIPLFCFAVLPATAQRRGITAVIDNKKPLAVIPFQLKGKQVIIPVTLSGSSDTLRFIFDTGAEVTVLHSGTAERLKLGSSRQGFMSGTNNAMIKTPMATLNALYFKEVRMPYVSAYLENLDNLGQVDGVIGIALLKNYIVKIDYLQQQLLLFRQGSTPTSNTGRLLHFQLNFTTPVIEAAIQLPDGSNLAGHYHITTGGDYGILFNWPYVEKYRLHERLPTLSTDRVQDMVKVLTYTNSSVSELKLGGYPIGSVPVSYCKDINDLGVFTEVAGAIGFDVWKQFTVTINYDKKELYIELPKGKQQ